MPIKRYFLPDNSPSHFHVTEEFEVYDGTTALAVDHLLNHLKVLLAGGGSQDVVECMAEHPRYAKQQDFEKNLDSVLLQDCIVLLQYTAKISDFSTKQEQRDALLEEMRVKIPFFDYRYPKDSFPPEAEQSN